MHSINQPGQVDEKLVEVVSSFEPHIGNDILLSIISTSSVLTLTVQFTFIYLI